MKIRISFVSNSSSSSFVVVDPAGSYNDLPIHGSEDEAFSIGKHGETEFGWGPDVIIDADSRVNFAYLQTLYTNEETRNKWQTMIQHALWRYIGTKEMTSLLSLEYKIPEGMKWGYIDHQSNAGEGENIEIFEDQNILEKFLFGEHSKIVLDNNNH